MTQLLQTVFNYDFAKAKNAAAFYTHFFGRTLTLGDLKQVSDFVRKHKITLGKRDIPAAILIKGNKSKQMPFAILAQLHGNEPAGLAGILLAMALAQAGKLERDVIGVIGNPLAAQQYFEAWEKAPRARQETRDAFRCGLSPEGELLPDMNRIPVDFMKRTAFERPIRRAQELFLLGQHISGIVDIHSARGNMVCITDHKHDKDLRYSPVRNVLTGLAEAISAHMSGAVTVQTLKTILGPLANIESQTGIEAGRHELTDTPLIASSYTLALLYTLGITAIPPLEKRETGSFVNYAVKPRITYADLIGSKNVQKNDRVYMATECRLPENIPPRSDQVVVRKKDGSYVLQTILQFIVQPAGQLEYALYQFDEMEAVKKNAVVAVAIPSGAVLKAPSSFSGIFWSKAAALYDKDPAVGPWPVAANTLASVKFCYPCDVKEMKIDF